MGLGLLLDTFPRASAFLLCNRWGDASVILPSMEVRV